MLSIRSRTLGGEGCPAVLLTEPLENRNIYAVLGEDSAQARAGSVRTGRERACRADTPATQETRFLFSACSASGVLIGALVVAS